MSIVLDRDEMRELYRIINDRIDAYRVSRADKSTFSSFLRNMRYIYEMSNADEFVLVFKGVEIEKLFLNTKRFDNRVHHSASTNFMLY